MKEEKLDVDFIGGQGSLTPEEEEALSKFFKERKLSAAKAGDTKKPKAARSNGSPQRTVQR